jgi:hypothetical protein
MRANETSSIRAGLPPGWTTADEPNAQNLRPLIGELATLVVPALLT